MFGSFNVRARVPEDYPQGPIDWNTADIPAYPARHKTTAEHHTYATAAAVMRAD